METTGIQKSIIKRLNNGVKFGLYDGGKSCYFEDGMRVNYKELWAALRVMHNLETSHNKTLFELCPDTYLGIFPYKFHKFTWTKKILSMIPGLHG